MRAPGEPYCAAISPDGRLVLTGGANRATQLWDANTGRPVGEPLKGPAEVSAVAFSPDGADFLVGDHGGFVRFYETASRRLLDRTLAHADAGRIEAIAFGPDGQSRSDRLGRHDGTVLGLRDGTAAGRAASSPGLGAARRVFAVTARWP